MAATPKRSIGPALIPRLSGIRTGLAMESRHLGSTELTEII